MLKRWLTYLTFVALLPAAAAVNAADFGKDFGTGADGVFVLPKSFAKHCDISSEDAADADKVTECLNSIIALQYGDKRTKADYHQIMLEALREMSSDSLDVALNKKSLAGDHYNEMQKILEEADKAGAKPSKEETIRKKQELNGQINATDTKNVADLLDVYGSLLTLNAMDNYYNYELGSDLPNPEKGEE